MHRRQILHAFLGLAALWPARAARPDIQKPSDLMPMFWRAYGLSRTAGAPARVAVLAREFFLPEAEYYTAAGFNGAGTHGRLFDSRVEAWLSHLDTIAPRVRAISDRLPADWSGHEARFEAAGLTLRQGVTGCFMPSLFAFTGYSRIWNRRPMLFIAPDGIALQPEYRSGLAVLIDHEAFHVYHAEAAPDLSGPALWIRLWREGLAIFASARLNPSALAKLPDSAIAECARFVVKNPDGDAQASLLFDEDRHSTFPNRMGYLLGLKLAQMIAGQRPLKESAHMPAARVRPALLSALSELADKS